MLNFLYQKELDSRLRGNDEFRLTPLQPRLVTPDLIGRPVSE
jgi:hypothetical protein